MFAAGGISTLVTLLNFGIETSIEIQRFSLHMNGVLCEKGEVVMITTLRLGLWPR